MTKLLQQFTKLFTGTTSELETFISSKQPKTHADVEFWTKYFEYRGL
jgi:hypothetical protein